MIESFADKETEQFYITKKSRKFPPSIHSSAIRRLDYLKWAKYLTDLRVPPGNRLETLKGDRVGEYSIRITSIMAIL